MAPDSSNGRAFFIVVDDPWTFRAYRLSTYALIASAELPGTTVRRLARWGDNGVAYVADGILAIFTTTLVN